MSFKIRKNVMQLAPARDLTLDAGDAVGGEVIKGS